MDGTKTRYVPLGRDEGSRVYDAPLSFEENCSQTSELHLTYYYTPTILRSEYKT